jgi:amidase
VDSTELAFAGPSRQAELIRAREASPRELVDLYLERIERIDPRLNSFRVVFAERARVEAQQAEGRAGAGDDRPLLGVPVAVKDNLDVAGEVTALGSSAAGEPATADSEQVRRLRQAGAIVIGKTHMSELAIFPWTESQTFGVTRNPWNTDLSPGGSSGGSGAAVAAGLASAASATDGGGSIRIPAACNGLVGLKTQRGRVPFTPEPVHWHALSVAGCLSRRVIDTALWLDVVSGPLDGDPLAIPAPDRPFAEAAARPPEKLRVAVSYKAPTGAKMNEAMRRAIEETAGVLRSLGHEVRDADVDYPDPRPLFVPRWAHGIHQDVEAMAHPERLERRTRSLSRLGRVIGERRAQKARDKEPRAAGRLNKLFADHDVVLTATTPHPPHRADQFHGKGWFASLNGAVPVAAFANEWNVTGQPAMSIPAPSLNEGLPVGVQLIGRPSDEATLIALAAQLEAEVGWPERRPPVD